MLDLVRKRIFLVTGGIFLVYGVSAMGGDPPPRTQEEGRGLPTIDMRYLRVREIGETLPPVYGDPFRADRPAPESGERDPEAPWASTAPRFDPRPLPPGPSVPPAGIEVLPETLVLNLGTDAAGDLILIGDKPSWLSMLPNEPLFTLNGTLSAGSTVAARVNGTLLQPGEGLQVAGAKAVLQRVDGHQAVLTWRDMEIRLDLQNRPTVGPLDLPIDG